MVKSEIFSTIAAICGSCLACVFGGWDKVIECLVICIAIDYITGIMSAYATKSLSSAVGFKGFLKKVLIFAIVAVAATLDKAIGNPDMLFRTATCFFYIANEGLSILENASKLGIPLPQKLEEALIQLQDDNSKKGE